jgi:hypothetical protein
VDRHHFDAYQDPDPTFHFDDDPDQDPTSNFTQAGKSGNIFLTVNHSSACLHCFVFPINA